MIEPQILMGIDPGLANTGWGMVEARGRDIRVLDSGCVVTAAGVPIPLRLRDIFNALSEVAERHRPSVVAVEQLFFAKNVKSAFDVAQARGVAILGSTFHGAELQEYTPLQIKQAVVGKGRASKEQVMLMVQLIVKLERTPTINHTADALAAAICHCNFQHLDRRMA